MKIKNKIIIKTAITIFGIIILFVIPSILSNNSRSKYLDKIPSTESIYDSLFSRKEESIQTYSSSEDNVTTIEAVDINSLPEFNNTPYIYINNNIPQIKEDILNADIGTYYYSELDELGRVGLCYCIIDSSYLPTEERGDISNIEPTGWSQNKYDGINNGYLYNRCHLIPASFNGPCGRPGEREDLLRRDLFTGTRYLNIDGQWQFEETVLNYLKENQNKAVIYQIEPIFLNTELVPRGVHIQAQSISDNEVSFNVFCYNVQPEPAIEINYSTGENHLRNNNESVPK